VIIIHNTNYCVPGRLFEKYSLLISKRDYAEAFPNMLKSSVPFEIDYFSAVSVNEEELSFLLLHCGPMRVMTSSLMRFLDHTQRRNTDGRTLLDE